MHKSFLRVCKIIKSTIYKEVIQTSLLKNSKSSLINIVQATGAIFRRLVSYYFSDTCYT